MKADKFKLTPEDVAEKARLEALHKCDITVISVPLDKDGKEYKTLFLKEPDMYQLDAYMAAVDREQKG